MAKEYILIQGLSALVFLLGGAALCWKRKKNVEHNCKTCAHCKMVKKGKDGKLIYSCGRMDMVEEPGFYYEWAVPVYCGKWSKRKDVFL